ncbi:MAG: AAA family ATPase [Clostridiaceae bacterium]|jgi:chloramphenicol 3-O phosphotransferase|nr:AAA family ATPase [Clostridiaceae bacterium]
MQRGKIVLINGVSSSGKTTLSKVLQARFPDQYFLLPGDILNEISPQKNSRSHDVRFTADPKPVMSAFFGCVKAFADNGLNVIVETIFTNDVHFALDNCLSVFPDCNYSVLFVHVSCPLEELRRREKERGDRKIGWGESLLPKLDPQDTYDITVDTFKETIEECADKIIELMNYPEQFTAFKTLWSQRSK